MRTRLSGKQRLELGAVALVMVILVIVQSLYACRREISSQRERARLNARTYSEELRMDFQRGIAVTETLKDLIIDNGGIIHNFDQAAKQLMEDNIGSIQIAPGGVVTQIYPEAGNEAGKMDLMSDPDRGPVVQYGRDRNKVTMQGPFDLKQGGRGIAIRNPVFLEKGNEKSFWGFTVVIIRVPEIFEHTLKNLESFGYDYCVETTTSPLSSDSVRVAASLDEKSSLKAPETETFRAGECTWTISVAPKGGWSAGSAFQVVGWSAVLAVLIVLMAYLLLNMYNQRRQMQQAADTDVLTGLYSRRGFMKKLNELMEEDSGKPLTAVFLDLDDFKLINDLHGHQTGDEALKNLAESLRESFPEDALIGRTGGDEFCVLLCGKTAEESASRIREAAAKKQSFPVGKETYPYTISVGYADYPAQASDRRELMTHADQALYVAKLEGKHRCVRYDKAMDNVRRTQLGFNVRSIAAGIPGAFLIYKAHGEEQILFANDDLIRMTGCRNFEDFLAYTKSSFHGFVHPDDLERVEREIWTQVRAEKDKAPEGKEHYDDVVNYRMVTKDGTVRQVMDFGRLIRTDNYGEIFFVFIREKE